MQKTPHQHRDTITKLLEKAASNRRQSEVFAAFARLTACALACQTRETEYLEEAKSWDRDQLNTFAQAMACLTMAMEDTPYQDLLGNIHMDLLGEKGKQHNGEFHTPPSICSFMAQLTMAQHQWPEHGEMTVCEPACGAGAQILALAEVVGKERLHRLRVQAIDISSLACDMCFINTTLWGIPTVVIHGNSLSCESWNAWPNFHMLMNAPFSYRRWMSIRATNPEPPQPQAAIHPSPPVAIPILQLKLF